MIYFFGDAKIEVFAVETIKSISNENLKKFNWLFEKKFISNDNVFGSFIGPKKTMVTPWSTNAVEITQNMGVTGIKRIEKYIPYKKGVDFDFMLIEKVNDLSQELFDISIKSEKKIDVENILEYNENYGLSLSNSEINYLNSISVKLKRPLTDSEVFGFSQVNSEHCRHKIFNGEFIIDKIKKKKSLFSLIKETSKINPNSIVSAYKDNVAFIDGPEIIQFAPQKGDIASSYKNKKIKSVISLKAETHNFPTTVEPFNGAATGTGGEIRDRLAGGKGSIPLAGTAVYMTPYSRISKNNFWEKKVPLRKWLYQSPIDILIKASNGASDFGNKFGQPLISGSILTFENIIKKEIIGFDKVIMQAGGIGYGIKNQSKKGKPKKGDKIIILGGDNYRIGMGGAAVSSSNTGSFKSSIELNAVQRSNPEMQKRIANAIRSLVETTNNPIISIHDHGAGGHLNCLTELTEETGGYVEIDKLPVGDPTLSAKEIIGNESQERMGLILSPKDSKILEKIAKRERAPYYEVGYVTEDNKFTFVSKKRNEKSIELKTKYLFGGSPRTIIKDKTRLFKFKKIQYNSNLIINYLDKILKLEGVACKDWLTNKVDRCVTGKVAQQQCIGELQIPLSNCGVIALDFIGYKGIATSIGHSPISGLIDAKAGSINSIGEALTNIIWAPLKKGIKSISLSANWMWPCNNSGEDARLYEAVEACSKFSSDLGINIPTGKDSLSMLQKYSNKKVKAPGTVIISASGECSDIKKIIVPVAKFSQGDLYYVEMCNDKFHLGGSSLAQVLGQIGKKTPTVKNSNYFKKAFNKTQELIKSNIITSGHDIGSGGLITSLLELCFPSNNIGLNINLKDIPELDTTAILFSEKIGLLLQSKENLTELYKKNNIKCLKIGSVIKEPKLIIKHHDFKTNLSIKEFRDKWFNTSYLLDSRQTLKKFAIKRKNNLGSQPLNFTFPRKFEGNLEKYPKEKIKAAIIREKGSNSEREMAHAMFISGFDVKDIHMTDLIEGRENLEDVKFIAAVGGFSNSDVLGSAKGWAGAFNFNKKAKDSLENFFKREDTLSLGVCNGCQLFISLGLINLDHDVKPKMTHNESKKFECSFTSVKVQKSSSVMMKDLEGTELGIWAAHGEGKFSFPLTENKYQIPAKYSYNEYPSNPNGSDYNAAMLSSKNGRHLVMMPHLERSSFPWNWAYYPENRDSDEISPWIIPFQNAYKWLITK